MTNDRLEALKRQWLTSNSVEDHANYLREQIRLQILTQSQVELAAYCGHEAAQIATSHSIKPASGYADLQQKVKGLALWDRRVWTLAALAATQAMLGQFAGGLNMEPLIEGLNTAEDWLKAGKKNKPPKTMTDPFSPNHNETLVNGDNVDMQYTAKKLSDADSGGWHSLESATSVIISASSRLNDSTWDAIAKKLIEVSLVPTSDWETPEE